MTLHEEFEAAARDYKHNPNPMTFTLLQRRALRLMETHIRPDDRAWRSVDMPDAFYTTFGAIRVTIEGHLGFDDEARVNGCLGYALRAVLAAGNLPMPTRFTIGDGVDCLTALTYEFDSITSRRTEPDFAAAFAAARQMIAEGTPVRQSDRAGCGTRGTRLVEGIGSRRVWIEVR